MRAWDSLDSRPVLLRAATSNGKVHGFPWFTAVLAGLAWAHQWRRRTVAPHEKGRSVMSSNDRPEPTSSSVRGTPIIVDASYLRTDVARVLTPPTPEAEPSSTSQHLTEHLGSAPQAAHPGPSIESPLSSGFGGSAGTGYVNMQAEYWPHSLDLGSMRVGESRLATVTVIAPVTGDLTVAFRDTLFYVAHIVSFTGSWKIGPYGKLIGEVDHEETFVPPGRRFGQHAPTPLPVQAGQRIEVTVGFWSQQEGGTDGLQLYSGGLTITGPLWAVDVPLRASVTLLGDAPLVLVVPDSTALSMLVGQAAGLGLKLTNGQKPTTVSFHADQLPSGVSMPDVQVPLAASETKSVQLSFDVAADAEEGQGMPGQLTIDYGGVSKDELSLGISIYEPHQVVRGDFNEGDVQIHTWVDFRSDGSWIWGGSVYDDGTFMGDNYAVAFWFNLPNADGRKPGDSQTGALGPDDRQAIDRRGSDPWIRDNFGAIVDAGITFYGYSSWDGGGVAASILGLAIDKLKGEIGSQTQSADGDSPEGNPSSGGGGSSVSQSIAPPGA